MDFDVKVISVKFVDTISNAPKAYPALDEAHFILSDKLKNSKSRKKFKEIFLSSWLLLCFISLEDRNISITEIKIVILLPSIKNKKRPMLWSVKCPTSDTMEGIQGILGWFLENRSSLEFFFCLITCRKNN